MRSFILSLVAFLVSQQLTSVQSADDDCPLACVPNNSVCKIHDYTKEYYCECLSTSTTGFLGVYCQTPYVACSDTNGRSWRCLNGGTCHDEGCNCPSEFSGTNCDVYTGPCTTVASGSECSTTAEASQQSDEQPEDEIINNNNVSPPDDSSIVSQPATASEGQEKYALGGGAIAGIVISTLIVFAFAGFVVMKTTQTGKKQSSNTTSSKHQAGGEDQYSASTEDHHHSDSEQKMKMEHEIA